MSKEITNKNKSYLNLGCGNLLMKNAVNVDIHKPSIPIPEDIVFVESDVTKFLEQCPWESYKKIFMFYLLEHLAYREVSWLTYLLNKVLESNGEVIGITEDFEEICKKYLSFENKILAIQSLYYNVLSDDSTETPHKSIWNEDLLELYFGRDEFRLEKLTSGVGARNVGMFFIFKKIGHVGITNKEVESWDRKI